MTRTRPRTEQAASKRSLIPFLLTAAAVSTPLHAQEAAQPVADADQTQKIDLKVLVTGVPGSERLEDFKTFLGEYFIEVGEAPYTEFEPALADGYDVVIFDAEITPSDNSIGLPRGPELPRDYNRASVVVSGAGVFAVDELNPKIDWL